MFRAAPAQYRRLSTMNGISPAETAMGLPTSSDSRRARLSASPSIASASLSIIALRSLGARVRRRRVDVLLGLSGGRIHPRTTDEQLPGLQRGRHLCASSDRGRPRRGRRSAPKYAESLGSGATLATRDW